MAGRSRTILRSMFGCFHRVYTVNKKQTNKQTTNKQKHFTK